MAAAQGLIAVLGYAANCVFARYLEIEAFGELRYAISVTALLIIVTHPGLASALFKSVVDGYPQFARRAYALTVKWSLAGSLILAALALYYRLAAGQGTTAGLLLVGALVLPFLYLDRWLMVYLARGLFAQGRSYELSVRLASFLAAALAAWLTRNVLIVMLAMFLPQALLNPYFSWRSLRLAGKLREDPEQERWYRAYGRRLSLYSILPTISRHLDKILVANLLSFDALSVYYIATIIPTYLLSSLKSALTVPVQRWSGEGRGLAELARYRYPVLLASAAMTGLLYLALPRLILLFGARYAEAVPYARLLALPFLLIPFSLLAQMLLTFSGHERAAGRILNGYSLLKTLLFPALVPWYGLMGAVAAQLVAELVLFVLLAVRLCTLRSPAPAEGIAAERLPEPGGGVEG